MNSNNSNKSNSELSYNNLLEQAMRISSITPYSEVMKNNSVIFSDFMELQNIYKPYYSQEYSKSIDNSFKCLANPVNYSYKIPKLNEDSYSSFIIAPVISKPTISSCLICKTDNSNFNVIYFRDNGSQELDCTAYNIPSNNINNIIKYLGYTNNNDFSNHDFAMELEISSTKSEKINLDQYATLEEKNSTYLSLESILKFSLCVASRKTLEELTLGKLNFENTPTTEVLNNIKNDFDNFYGNNISDAEKQQFSATIDSLIEAYKFNKDLSDANIPYLASTVITSLKDAIQLFLKKENIKQEDYDTIFLNETLREKLYSHVNNYLELSDLDTTFFDISSFDLKSVDSISNYKEIYDIYLSVDDINALKNELSFFNITNLMDNYDFLSSAYKSDKELYTNLNTIKKYNNMLSSDTIPSVDELKKSIFSPSLQEAFPVATSSLCLSYAKALNIEALKKVLSRDYEGAKKLYDFLIEKYPYNETFLYERGKLFGALGKYDIALNDFKKAATLAPKSINIKQNYAISLAYNKDIDAAIKVCDELLDIDPSNQKLTTLKNYFENDITLDSTPDIILKDASNIVNKALHTLNVVTEKPISPLKRSASFSDLSSALSTAPYDAVTPKLNARKDFSNLNFEALSLTNFKHNEKNEHNEFFLKLTEDQQENEALHILGYSTKPNVDDKIAFCSYFHNLVSAYKDVFSNEEDIPNINFINSLENSQLCLENPKDYSKNLHNLLDNPYDTGNFIIAPTPNGSDFNNVVIFPYDDDTLNVVTIDSVNSNSYTIYSIDREKIDELSSHLGYSAFSNVSKEEFSGFLENICKDMTERNYFSQINYSENMFSSIEHAINFAYSTSVDPIDLESKEILTCIEYLLDKESDIVLDDFSIDTIDALSQLSEDELETIYQNIATEIKPIIEPVNLQSMLLDNIIQENPDIADDINEFVNINFANNTFCVNMNNAYNNDMTMDNELFEEIFRESFPYSSQSELVEQLNNIDYYTLTHHLDYIKDLCKDHNLDNHLKKLEDFHLFLEVSKNRLTDEELIVSDLKIEKIIKDMEPYFSSATHTLGCMYCDTVLNDSNIIKEIDNLTNLTKEQIKDVLDNMIENLTEALTVMPNNAACYSRRGLLLAMRGKEELSRADILKAINLEPNNIAIRQEYGYSLFVIGKKQEAILENEKILLIDPNYEEAKNNIFKLKSIRTPLKNHLERDTATTATVSKENSISSKIKESSKDILKATEIATATSDIINTKFNEGNNEAKLLNKNDFTKSSQKNIIDTLMPPNNSNNVKTITKQKNNDIEISKIK